MQDFAIFFLTHPVYVVQYFTIMFEFFKYLVLKENLKKRNYKSSQGYKTDKYTKIGCDKPDLDYRLF